MRQKILQDRRGMFVGRKQTLKKILKIGPFAKQGKIEHDPFQNVPTFVEDFLHINGC